MSVIHHTQSAGGVVVNKKGEVALVSQYGTSWSLPKGHIEVGEDALTAARREIYEETGVKNVVFVRALGSYQRSRLSAHGTNDTSELKTIHLFLFMTDQEWVKPVDPHNPEARWVPRERVVEYLTHQKDKEFFLSILPTL
mgnify:CR=1 FL=1